MAAFWLRGGTDASIFAALNSMSSDLRHWFAEQTEEIGDHEETLETWAEPGRVDSVGNFPSQGANHNATYLDHTSGDSAVCGRPSTKSRSDTSAQQIYKWVDEDGALAGMASIHSLLLANGTDQISAVMKTETPTFLANMPVESVKNHPAWHENRIIPVTDSSGKLVGNLTFEAAQRNNMETGREQAKSVMETGSALGELYLIGLTAFLQSVSKGD